MHYLDATTFLDDTLAVWHRSEVTTAKQHVRLILPSGVPQPQPLSEETKRLASFGIYVRQVGDTYHVDRDNMHQIVALLDRLLAQVT